MKHTKNITTILLLTIIAATPALAYQTGAWSPSIRAIHASPDAPPVDIWANGAPLFTNIGYSEEQTANIVQQGTYDIQVVPTGETTPIVIDADLRLKNARDYTVIAINTLDNITPLVIEDMTKASRYKSMIRFIHASPDAPAVDIRVKEGPTLFKDVAFGEVADYRKVGEGTYDLEVVVAGTNTVALALENITLQKGTVYTAVALGTLAEESLTAAIYEDNTRPRKPMMYYQNNKNNDDTPWYEYRQG